MLQHVGPLRDNTRITHHCLAYRYDYAHDIYVAFHTRTITMQQFKTGDIEN
jgi:hypothetical protein